MKKLLFLSLLIALGLTLSACGTNTVKPITDVGGKNHNTQEDFSAGISVNGTEVIGSTRAATFSGGITAGTSGATTTVDLGKVCFKLLRNNGSATAAYAYINSYGNWATTSVSCL